MDASKITQLLQKQNTRYINRNQTVDASTLTWKNQIQSSKYIKGVKTCEGEQNCNVPTNPACPDFAAAAPGSSQLVTNGVNSFGGAGRTTAIQSGSPQQFLSVYAGAAGSASQVYSSEAILLQRAGKESCGVSSTTTPAPQNTYVELPACYCVDTNGPTNSTASQLSNPTVAGNPSNLPINNQSNPYLPPFDTYYAMKNPSANCKNCPDQNQKHFVKQCHSRFPDANNGVNAVFSPCDNVTFLDPVTKQFKTTNANPPTCDGCILEEIQTVPGPSYCLFCQWATYLSGTGNVVVNEVVQDSQGNVYITGNYASTGNVTVKNVSGTGQSDSNIILPATSGNNNNAIFLIKYSSSGTALWAANLNGTGNEIGYSVTVDSANNVIIAGQYVTTSQIFVRQWNSSTGSIEDSTITLPATNSISSYIIKYSSAGTAIWAARIDSISANNDIINYVTVDSNNNIYVTGSYFETAGNSMNIYNGTTIGNPTTTTISLPPPATAGASMFLIKYNSAGVTQWATYLGGSGSQSLSQGQSIAVDSSFNVYVTGTYRSDSGAATIYNGTTSTTPPSSSGITLLTSSTGSVFLIKYTQLGITLTASLATIIDSSASLIESGDSIAIDSSGNLVITGYYSGLATIYNANVNTQIASSLSLPFTTSGNTLTFIVKYNTSLQVIWGTFLKSTTFSSQGRSITAGSDGYIYVTGQYTSPITLMNATTTGQVESSIIIPYSGSGGAQIYLVKYDINGQAVCATYIQTGFTSTIGQSVSVINNTIFLGGQYQTGLATPVIITDILSTGDSQRSLVTLPSFNTVTGLLIKYTQS
jgi:hypothetical protein